MLLNSKLIGWLHNKVSSKGNKGLFPIIEIPHIHQLPLIEKAYLMLSLNKKILEESSKFTRSLQRKFAIEQLPKKLQGWYLLSYKDFICELLKKKIKLSLAQEAEW